MGQTARKKAAEGTDFRNIAKAVNLKRDENPNCGSKLSLRTA